MFKQVSSKVNVESKDEINTLREDVGIKNFISSISSKNYALAHKYLQQVVNNKLKARITTSLDKPLF